MTEENKNKSNSDDIAQAWKPVLFGGIAGAGMGLLASPETGKKVAARIGKSEVIRGAGREIRRTAQDILMEQAMLTIRKSAAGYMEKYEGKLLGQNQEKDRIAEAPESKENDDDAKYNELKEENKNIHENLQRIEEKLNALLETKG